MNVKELKSMLNNDPELNKILNNIMKVKIKNGLRRLILHYQNLGLVGENLPHVIYGLGFIG